MPASFFSLIRLQTCLCLFMFWITSRAEAQVRTVWQIGKFDRSPLEYSDAAKEQDVTFHAGTSDWKTSWPAHQGIGHPYKIEFSLDSLAGLYSLKIATLIERPRVPSIEVSINGHAGIFYLHPHLSYHPGDFSYAFDPHEADGDLRIDLPPRFLKLGNNVLSLTWVDNPPTASGQERFSGIVYDAVSLEQDPSRRFSAGSVTAELIPTIFFRQATSGLVEIVDAFVRSNSTLKPGTAELEMQGKRYRANLPGGREYGEELVSFEIPEWEGMLHGKLRLPYGTRAGYDVTLAAERKWTIYVVPHTHLDVGYTDYQGKVAETQARVLSQAAELIHQHPDFRFSMDGSWNLQQLLDTRPKSKRDEILDLIRTGKMAMPAQYCNLLTGYASLETLYRSLYESKTLAREYGLPFEYANITDVPTYSGSYPSVLASSGVKYWVAAANNDRAPIFHFEHWNEKSPFWWQGPDGKKVLFWYSRHYMQVQTLFGLPPELAAVRESLPIYLQAYSKPTYKPDVALIYGTQVENTDLFPSTATFASDWNKEYAYPKLNYASFPDFFHYLDEHYGKDLPTYKGDGGPYWEDGVGADAYFVAEDRQNQNRALSAEVLSSVTHTINSNLNPPMGLFDDIWRNIVLFAEHTWLSYNSISQPDHEEAIKQLRVKDGRAESASLEIEDVMNRSLSQLADEIHIPASTLVVFNSLNWRRDALVETDLFENPKLIDLTTQQEVPLQILYEKEKFVHVRFLAKDLPSVGYKCFRIEYGKQAAPKPPVSNEQTIENAFYKITLAEDSGAVASIYDKQLQRELVDAHSPYKFGQYIYVSGGDGNSGLINPFSSLPPPELNIHAASNGKLAQVEHLAWGTSILLNSSAENTPAIQTEILLFNNEKKIEFRYRLQKKYTTAKEGVYFAFPVALAKPAFAYAPQQGWLDPAHDLMKGGSLEWFSIQHWMAAYDTNVAVGIVPLDAPLASFGDINRGKWPGQFQPASGTLFSYVMNNYWDTNYRAGQGGNFTFRYAVTSAAKLDGGALTHLAIEEMRPLELDRVVSQDKAGNPPRPLPAAGESVLETTGAGTSLITWKAAEDGHGTILRLAETTGKPTETTVRLLRGNVKSANLCSGVEDQGKALPVENNGFRLSFHPFEVLTVRLVTD
ncbi:MAG TPA: polysaccharide lyase family protein [Bryobacteraceae bacterium]